MSQTKFSIASQALIHLRANPVSSFTDGTNEADIMAEVYDTWARDALGRHPWSFARRREQLTRENKTQPGWKYLYKIPATALRVFAVFNTDDIGAQPIKRYRILSDDAGQYIATNEEKIFAEFTTYVPENVWPSWFVEYGVFALAAFVAMPVSDDEDLAARMQAAAYGPPGDNETGGKFGKAAIISDQQNPPEYYGQNEIIAARFS